MSETATTDPTVSYAQGTARGVWRDTGPGGPYARSAAFLGLPFAEPPVGALRFGAPVPAAGWEGVRDATAYGPTAQRRAFGEVTAIPEPSIPGEATLNVNVFTPVPGQPEAGLPVFVWIHGGGYKAGSPASPWYDGRAFNRDGVVTATLSYRLGFDGFGWIPDAPHNRGLLDQIEALRWVRRHIAAFGGDPARVTIGGQSAGGGSVWALMVSPAAHGLFGAAISHSGALDVQAAETAEANGEALAELAGVPWTRAGLASLTEDRILDLQDRIGVPEPPSDLAGAVDGILGTGGVSLAFLPYVDGAVLVQPVREALAAGVSAEVPVITGATAHEFTAVGPILAPLLATGDLAEVLRGSALGSVADRLLAAYDDLPGLPALVLGQLMTELTFRVPMITWADLRGTAPTWLYDFRLRHSETGLAAHCAELPFAWDLLDAPLVAASCDPHPPQELADLMHRGWVGFVHDHRAPWSVWSPDGLAAVFDREPSVGPAFALQLEIARALRDQ
ncbi:MAG TPA: carboxylesterase family protein [Microlunatus sp.]